MTRLLAALITVLIAALIVPVVLPGIICTSKSIMHESDVRENGCMHE